MFFSTNIHANTLFGCIWGFVFLIFLQRLHDRDEMVEYGRVVAGEIVVAIRSSRVASKRYYLFGEHLKLFLLFGLSPHDNG